jgi:hypothetical protein
MGGVKNSKLSEAMAKIIKNIHASLMPISPDAIGLSFVLLTSLSNL